MDNILPNIPVECEGLDDDVPEFHAHFADDASVISDQSLRSLDSNRSTDTICKDYALGHRKSVCYPFWEAQPFFQFLLEAGVRTVVRANHMKEPGMLTPSYDASRLRAYGMRHVNSPFQDVHGAVPAPRIIAQVLEHLDRVEGDAAVCFHCKGGFGRSVLLACCFIIHKFDVSGRAALAWSRVARPGAITTTLQEKFLAAITGRAGLHKIIKMTSPDAASNGCCALQ